MPINLRDLNDTDFGTLDQNKNKNIMRYNHAKGKFDIIPADNIISTASTLPQSFVDTIESEIDVNNITFTGLDGGSF